MVLLWCSTPFVTRKAVKSCSDLEIPQERHQAVIGPDRPPWNGLCFTQRLGSCGGTIQDCSCACPPVFGALALPGVRGHWDSEDTAAVQDLGWGLRCVSLWVLKDRFPISLCESHGFTVLQPDYICSVKLTPPFLFFFFDSFQSPKIGVKYNSFWPQIFGFSQSIKIDLFSSFVLFLFVVRQTKVPFIFLLNT